VSYKVIDIIICYNIRDCSITVYTWLLYQLYNSTSFEEGSYYLQDECCKYTDNCCVVLYTGLVLTTFVLPQ